MISFGLQNQAKQYKNAKNMKNNGMSNTIERIGEEDEKEMKVNSSHDTASDKDNKAEDSESSHGDPNEKDQFGATRALRHQI